MRKISPGERVVTYAGRPLTIRTKKLEDGWQVEVCDGALVQGRAFVTYSVRGNDLDAETLDHLGFELAEAAVTDIREGIVKLPTPRDPT